MGSRVDGQTGQVAVCAAMPALLLAGLADPLFRDGPDITMTRGAGEAVCGAVSGLEWSASGAVNAEGSSAGGFCWLATGVAGAGPS
jgi:hypothetical protein